VDGATDGAAVVWPAGGAVIRVLSLGAGVQSTYVLLRMLEGEIPPADVAIFADTGWEPRAVYDHLDRLERVAGDRIPVLRVTAGDLRSDALGENPDRRRFAALPLFVRRPDGGAGMLRRQCTKEYKITPIRRRIRELLAERGERRAELVFGISVDEALRMRDPDVAYLDHDYPLVDRRITRAACARELAAMGWDAPRSACVGCPYRDDASWRTIRENPDEWRDAVEFDRRLRDGSGATHTDFEGTVYLHRARRPLEEVDLSTLEEHGQLTLEDECDGLCGT
jgi:hypothetical protein